MIKKAVPHFFTFSNLFCGCFATYFAFQHQFNLALFFVLLGVFFDFFDGFFARLLEVESPLGVQLDSMADLVTSGMAPGMVMHQLFLFSGVKKIDYTFFYNTDFHFTLSFAPIALVAFLIPMGTALRLARFNLIKEPLPYFRGLPAPASALFLMGIPVLAKHDFVHPFQSYLLNPIALSLICFISVFLMNMHWKMFNLKLKGGMDEMLFPVLLLIGATVLFLLFKVAALSGIILLYILLSSIKFVFKK